MELIERLIDYSINCASLSVWLVLLQSFIPTLNTMTKFVILTIWHARKPSLKRWQLIRNYAGTLLFNTSSNICFEYLLELPHWCNSNKYPKHTFYEEIKIKYGICCISLCSLRILYNSKFILMAISSGTNAVVVTRFHCITQFYSNSYVFTNSVDTAQMTVL